MRVEVLKSGWNKGKLVTSVYIEASACNGSDVTLNPHSTFRPLAGEPNPFGDHPRGVPYHAELPLDHFDSERTLADRVLERLEPWFHIRREVVGPHCSGRELRIDAIIRPKGAAAWRNPAVSLGVEFKIPKGGLNAYTGWIAQAVSYTHVDWPDCGRLVVLTCPGAATWLDARATTESHEMLIAKRLSGQLGIGELVLRWAYGLTILLNGEHIWSERYGVARGRTWGLAPKLGHR
jgi:hypothetical protein